MPCELQHGIGDASVCDWCATALTGKQKRWCSRNCQWEWKRNHLYTQSKRRLLATNAWYECDHCGWWFQGTDIEVNHKVQAFGRHNKADCVHHQDNLEILCKPCHRKVTNEQRKAKQ